MADDSIARNTRSQTDLGSISLHALIRQREEENIKPKKSRKLPAMKEEVADKVDDKSVDERSDPTDNLISEDEASEASLESIDNDRELSTQLVGTVASAVMAQFTSDQFDKLLDRLGTSGTKTVSSRDLPKFKR